MEGNATIAITAGEPAGIGPELVALLAALLVFPFSLPLGEGHLNPLAALLLFVPQGGTPPGPWRLSPSCFCWMNRSALSISRFANRCRSFCISYGARPGSQLC